MITSQDLELFGVVSGVSSLAAAARALDVTPSAVTQRLRQLEQRLGVRLLERTSRRLHLTAEGQLLAQRGAEVLANLEELAEALVERREVVTGHLRVAAPFGFGRRYVASAMAALRTRHPEVKLTLTLFEDPVGLRGDAWDVLIHVGPLTDSALTLHRLAPNRRILCAAPSYLERHGMPERPEDLRQHACGVIREDQSDVTLWRFSHAQKEAVTVRVQPALSSNDGEVIKQWGLAGLGVIVRSEWDVAEDLRQGRLVPLLPAWQLPDADVVALLGARGGRVARTAHFLESLRQMLQPVPWRV
ncbi:LysR family transcriptional regulator [Microvirga makkahensis]|uniref:LysR family transcriptional regulator n=1 Tax=Microvirga makkahensis TaxID=1128670 RepID=A0A7X3MR85_9HYPH|nr:LysR family transcriptional regulator [Microvirga makkahensis]MXQ11729.1 LysR family transcriptional regulator [Microvirga makkahensis]